MYQDYKDVAAIYIVYIREAHAADSSWSVPYAGEKGINDHTSYEDRCTIADMLVKDRKLTIPCLIDGMDNNVNLLYKASPSRIFLIRKDGRLAVAASRGPFGLVPALDATIAWLKEYKETGQEPELPSN